MQKSADTHTNQVIGTAIRLAVEQFGFNLNTMVNITINQFAFCTSATKKAGKLACFMENVVHETCHLLVEDKFTTFNKRPIKDIKYEVDSSDRRVFDSDVNELHAIALQTHVMKILRPKAKWSFNSRCLETNIEEVLPERKKITVQTMMKDSSSQRLARALSLHILSQAIASDETYLNKAISVAEKLNY